MALGSEPEHEVTVRRAPLPETDERGVDVLRVQRGEQVAPYLVGAEVARERGPQAEASTGHFDVFRVAPRLDGQAPLEGDLRAEWKAGLLPIFFGAHPRSIRRQFDVDAGG